MLGVLQIFGRKNTGFFRFFSQKIWCVKVKNKKIHGLLLHYIWIIRNQRENGCVSLTEKREWYTESSGFIRKKSQNSSKNMLFSLWFPKNQWKDFCLIVNFAIQCPNKWTHFGIFDGILNKCWQNEKIVA